MPADITARALLEEAARLYDAPGSPFPRAAAKAWRTGFASAAEWMRLAHETVRAERPKHGASARQMNTLGLLKNGGSALASAALGLAAYRALRRPVVGLAAFVIGFYAIEGQMVFLFPLLLDGRADATRPLEVLAACRAETLRAGGTLNVMRVVMPISARMIFGGFAGQGFLRSWCLGCLAVVLWYERLQLQPVTNGVEQTA